MNDRNWHHTRHTNADVASIEALIPTTLQLSFEGWGVFPLADWIWAIIHEVLPKAGRANVAALIAADSALEQLVGKEAQITPPSD